MPSLNDAVVKNRQAAAQVIANFLTSAVAIESAVERTGYSHMGATLTDTVLQAGLNYRSVVLPRVRCVLNEYPQADTTTRFWQVLRDVGPCTVLRWSHPEKIGRLTRLIALFRKNSLETEWDVATWLCSTTADAELLSINGVGPKTLDYLKILVGIPTVAVDRHVKTLFRIVGLEFTEYDEFKTVIKLVAEILNVPLQVLDGMIWNYISTRPKQSNDQICGESGLAPRA